MMTKHVVSMELNVHQFESDRRSFSTQAGEPLHDERSRQAREAFYMPLEYWEDMGKPRFILVTVSAFVSGNPDEGR